MTALAELKAIVPTATAKAAVSITGADVSTLLQQVQLKAGELKILLKQLIAVHPSSGGDAANLAALNAVLAELV